MHTLKIIIAPNALKGSLTAIEAATAIQAGILENNPDANIRCLPIADGGDGFLAVLAHVLDAQWQTVTVCNPVGKQIQASFLFNASRSLAIIELASAAGLVLLKKNEYDILNASTYGVGQLICAALDLDVKHIILGIGGSATNDAGMGIATALGVKFIDSNNHNLQPSAQNLLKIHSIDTSTVHAKMKTVRFDIACDVENPLLGVTGAAKIFAAQKGASEEEIVFLENALTHFADKAQILSAINLRELKGGGAAGGVAAGLCGLFNANLCKGTDIVFELLDVENQLKKADLLITAEGKLDSQTFQGKAPYAIAKLAKKYDVPVTIIVGQSSMDLNKTAYPFDKIFSLMSLEHDCNYAIKHANTLLQAISSQLVDNS